MNPIVNEDFNEDYLITIKNDITGKNYFTKKQVTDEVAACIKGIVSFSMNRQWAKVDRPIKVSALRTASSGRDIVLKRIKMIDDAVKDYKDIPFPALPNIYTSVPPEGVMSKVILEFIRIAMNLLGFDDEAFYATLSRPLKELDQYNDFFVANVEGFEPKKAAKMYEYNSAWIEFETKLKEMGSNVRFGDLCLKDLAWEMFCKGSTTFEEGPIALMTAYRGETTDWFLGAVLSNKGKRYIYGDNREVQPGLSQVRINELRVWYLAALLKYIQNYNAKLKRSNDDPPRVAYELPMLLKLSVDVGLAIQVIREIISPENYHAIFGIMDPRAAFICDLFYKIPMDYIDIYKVACGCNA